MVSYRETGHGLHVTGSLSTLELIHFVPWWLCKCDVRGTLIIIVKDVETCISTNQIQTFASLDYVSLNDTPSAGEVIQHEMIGKDNIR